MSAMAGAFPALALSESGVHGWPPLHTISVRLHDRAGVAVKTCIIGSALLDCALPGRSGCLTSVPRWAVRRSNAPKLLPEQYRTSQKGM
jgi:hypothetical protein